MLNRQLTFRSVNVRPVLVPLRRPVVSRVGHFDLWPLILIDLQTEEGIVGRSYLEPYLKDAARYIVPAVHDLARARQGTPIRPLDDFQSARKALNLVGYEGLSMIAIAGLDMAAWDALAKAARLPLAEFLGGSIGPVQAYNSNGLWLTDVAGLAREATELIAEGEFTALKLRLGREALNDDLRAIRSVRESVGGDVKLMVDFNQGLSLGDALHRCHALDDEGLYWFEEPITYNNLQGYAQLSRELKTPVQLGENFYGPRELYRALEMKAGDYVMPDLMRIGGRRFSFGVQKVSKVAAASRGWTARRPARCLVGGRLCRRVPILTPANRPLASRSTRAECPATTETWEIGRVEPVPPSTVDSNRATLVLMLAFHATLGAATTAYCDAAAGLQIGKTKPGQNGVRASIARVARIK